MRTVLAAGDAQGYISLYQYPTHKGAMRRIFGGHAGRVTQVRFSFDDTFLVTAGEDGTLLQWRVVY